ARGSSRDEVGHGEVLLRVQHLPIESHVGVAGAELQLVALRDLERDRRAQARTLAAIVDECDSRIADIRLTQVTAGADTGLFAVDDVLLREFAANVRLRALALVLPVER